MSPDDVISAPTDEELDTLDDADGDDELDADELDDDADIDAEEDISDDEDLDSDDEPTDEELEDGQPEKDGAAEKSEAVKETAKPQGTPFSYRHRNAEIPIEGAVVVPGVGLTIPEAAIPALKQQLSAGREFGYARSNHEREVASVRQEAAAEVSKARAAGSKMTQSYMAIGRKVLTDPEGAFEDLLTFAQDLPAIAAKAESEWYKAQLERRDAEDQPTPEEVETHRYSLISTGYSEVLGELQGSDLFKDLFSPDDWKELQAYAESLGPALLEEREDSYVFRDDLLIGFAKRQANVIRRERIKAEERTKAAAANERKRAKERDAKKVKSARDKSSARTGNKTRKAGEMSKAEYDAYIRSTEA